MYNKQACSLHAVLYVLKRLSHTQLHIVSAWQTSPGKKNEARNVSHRHRSKCLRQLERCKLQITAAEEMEKCQHTIEGARSVMPDLQLKTLFLAFKKQYTPSVYLHVYASLNLSTSHITSTLGRFEVILQLTCYINYLLS